MREIELNRLIFNPRQEVPKGVKELRKYDKQLPESPTLYNKVCRILEQCSGKEEKCYRCPYERECVQRFFKLAHRTKEIAGKIWTIPIIRRKNE